MLRELRIQQFAIIDDVTIGFLPGLNVMTGETGAGKSIVMQALALLGGGRATADVIRGTAEEATLEALFDLPNAPEVLDALGLPADEEVLVRRTIARSGKGRTTVNGHLTTVTQLSQLGSGLIHIYGQHDQALLLRPSNHLDFLDQFGELGPARTRMAVVFREYAAARSDLDELRRDGEARQHRRELLEFQLQELTAAAVLHNEEALLRQHRERLRHAERIQHACRDAEAVLYSGDGAMTGVLGRIATQLGDLSKIDEPLGEPGALIASAAVQLEEAATQLRVHADRVPLDSERLESIEERLALIHRLARKYQVESTELPATLDALRQEYGRLESSHADEAAAEQRLADLRTAALELAGELSAARDRASRQLERRIAGELSALGMNGARFVVEHGAAADDRVEVLGPTGIDRVEFHLAANPGEGAKPLARVASGGELSRIMLALKALTAAVIEPPILIFDEVDAGIGGAVADAVARRLKSLAATRQLLCITHLPQIAAYADEHFAVEKRRARGHTVTTVRRLNADERIAELTRMLGGEVAPSEAAQYARRLVNQAQSAARR